jgi:hypothetical protein
MSDIEVSGNVYRIGRMDARKQFHVSRRLAPLLAGLGGAIAGKKEDIASTFQPIAEALAQMSDEDTDYILDNCLAVVSRQQGNQFAPVMARGGNMMFEDIDLPTMMQLTITVIRENLGGFFPASA